MENNGREILEEIKAEIGSLRSRLDALEEKLSSLEGDKPVGFIPAASFDEPIDFDMDDVPSVAGPEPEPVPEPEAAPAPAGDLPEDNIPPFDTEDIPVEEPVSELSEEPVAEPADEPAPEMVLTSEIEPGPAPAPKPKKAVSETTAYAWRTDMAGSPVANIISGISLNDRVLFINTLFSEDPILFQASLARFNAMSSLQEAEDYIAANFPGWNLSSEVVYRFMMAVRRKLK